MGLPHFHGAARDGSLALKGGTPAAETYGMSARARHRVYVVRLDHPRARGREAYYVGMTGLPVEERFANHKRGHKSARVVEKYGVALAYELFADIPAMPYEEATLAEPTLADDLRDLGYLVFGPTNRGRAKREKGASGSTRANRW